MFFGSRCVGFGFSKIKNLKSGFKETTNGEWSSGQESEDFSGKFRQREIHRRLNLELEIYSARSLQLIPTRLRFLTTHFKRNAENAKLAERGAEEISRFTCSASSSAHFASSAFRFMFSR